MNSFIYDTPELLEKLFVVAQEKQGIPAAALNAAALEIIGNLRTELSNLKAAANPTFNDIESLKNFKEWAVKNEASAQGNALVDQSGRFNLTVLPKFLTDLRDRFASNPEFSESLANVIDQANKTLGTKVSLYPPVKTDEAQPGSVGHREGEGGGSKFAIPESALNPEDKSKPGSAVAPQQQLANLAKSGGLSLLDGTTIDFDEINREAETIRNFIGDNNKRAWQALGQVTIRINNISGNFHQLIQGKTPGLDTLACTPQDDGAQLQNIIESIFNNGINQEMAKKHNQPLAYRYDELAEIAKYFAGLMIEISSFYNMILTIPVFKQTPDIASALQKQLEWASAYNTNFMSAQQRFLGDFARVNKVR
eukprot:gnl/Spiro4/6105_TR3133_c0_g1_i1.p1 gnl/Spiro4/6105_TR3133_c0_g1~~gnl/Spiro4/6105_TR3133_c0_g1_i1.p1  ORF type:complete len:366 (+),score=-19.97 gnl/Spiro4/6105_TR3133_c0_g1_i1:948-2045(+)